MNGEHTGTKCRGQEERKNAPTEVARTGQRGEGSLAELASTGHRGRAQDIEDSEITIYDISRYRRKEKEGRGKDKRPRGWLGRDVNKP